MAARTPAPEKRPGVFKQIKGIYQFTAEAYKWLPFLMIGLLLVGAGLGVLVAFLIGATAWWSILLWAITGLLFGVMASMFALTRLSTGVMYQRIDGRPGAVGQVMSTSLGRKWQSSEMPVGINPRTQEAVYRAVGRGGVVIVGEGSRGRLTRLVNEERARAQRVAHGVPVTVLYVGHDEDDVQLKNLAKTVKAIPKAIDNRTMAAVIKRIDSVSAAAIPIPKGIDPNRVRAPRPR
ncbi:MAG: DUF4191 family protein [Microbacteriaceae bacterium]|jgi:hypothetical protein|nr:DUF4191 family protein [Microbacteriaceae bacterium]HPZ35114.1 DUF4191 family protein [Microbacteriaceae bacterium]HQC92994.1 DUF4191 family protein [Microbacteriaceae bacterium]